jgi:chain length determinant protein EpsF
MRIEDGSFRMTLAHATRVLLNRRRLIFTTLLVMVGLALAVSLIVPKRYLASTALVVDARGNDPLNQTALSAQLLSGYIATQAEIISSRNVALKVAEREDIAARLGEMEDLPQDPTLRKLSMANILLRHLDVKTSATSNVMHVVVGSEDPQFAAAAANAFADAYLQTSLELQVDPARRQASWFEQQLAQLRDDVMQAQARLSSYQREHNILDVDVQRLDVENSRLEEISRNLVAAQAAMVDAETRRQQISRITGARQYDELPDILKQPLLQTLKSELARAEANLATVSSRYGRNHPQYRSAAAEAESLRMRLANEIETAKGSLVQAAEIAKRQVAQTQASLDEQRTRIIALSRQRDQLSVLNHELQSARTAYDEALRQTQQTRLQSRLDRTNIAILTAATVPRSPSSPRLMLNLALGVLLGLAAGCAIALYLEGMNPRVRTLSDVESVGVPVLAHMPLVPPQRRYISARQNAALEYRPA